MNKRFLVPVLALAGFGLPVGASIVTYCSGTAAACVANNQAVFDNAVATDNYTYDGLLTFTAANGVLSGNTYTDNLTGLLFTDFGTAPNGFTDAGGVLSSPNGNYDIQILIPATVLAVYMAVRVTAGDLCLDAPGPCGAGETSGFVGFINNSPSPTAPWIVDIGGLSSSSFTQILNFNAATAGSTGGETPEVGTLLLIGSGLIAMRWMRRWPRRRRVFQVPQTA
jgi:hypothetical protein